MFFTGTTLFTTTFTVIIVVCSLKSMCVPSFIVIIVGVNYMAIYVPIVMYGLRLFLQELQCLPNCAHVCMTRVRGCFHLTKFRYSRYSSAETGHNS